MKYSQWFGIAAAMVVISCCFLPWAFIPVIETVITGFDTSNTYYGKPGIIHVFLSILAIILFLLPFIWAKRVNFFVTTFNFAWALRNIMVVSRCEMGECPVPKLGIYGVLLFSLIMLIMSLLPKVKITPTLDS